MFTQLLLTLDLEDSIGIRLRYFSVGTGAGGVHGVL